MMRGYIEDMKAILAKMEEKWAALEADVGMAPADPVVAPPVETPVEAPAADDGSAANEPDPVADPAPDPITSTDSGDAVQV